MPERYGKLAPIMSRVDSLHGYRFTVTSPISLRRLNMQENMHQQAANCSIMITMSTVLQR